MAMAHRAYHGCDAACDPGADRGFRVRRSGVARGADHDLLRAPARAAFSDGHHARGLDRLCARPRAVRGADPGAVRLGMRIAMPALASALERLDEDHAPARAAGFDEKRMTDRGPVEPDEVLELRAALRDHRAVSFVGVAQPLGVLERIESLIGARAVEQPRGWAKRDQRQA